MQKLFSDGFHLVELLITLAILAILTALSVPIYSQYLIHERRLEAATILTKLAVAMEQYHVEHYTYESAKLSFLNFSEFIVRKNYQLFILTVSDNDYMLAAKPLGEQAEKDRACGTLTLSANGKRAITGPADIHECW